MVSIIIYVIIVIFLVIMSMFLPIGNENSTVRRLPWITFSIMALNVILYYATLPVLAGDLKEVFKAGTELAKFMDQHQELLGDEESLKKMMEIGFVPKDQAKAIKDQLKMDSDMADRYSSWSKTSEAQALRQELDQKLSAYKKATESSLYYKYGLAPNGKWQPHQLITAAFLHGGAEHLFLNLLCFFAIAFTLEDLWGRGVFLGFYLLGAAASCIPDLVNPNVVPSIGASGAISATMGAFLVRLPSAKIKLLFWPFRWLGFILGAKRPEIMVRGYIYLAAYFIAQVISWYFDKKSGGVSNIGYSIHIAGFIFGAGFAAVMKASRYEITHINPKIEAKVSFEAAAAVTQGLAFLDKGEVEMAERKLRGHLMKEPNSLETILALIQVYQRTLNFDQLNSMYGRLIRYHLTNNDREAALFAYDNLLSSFPDNDIAVRIPVRDWMAICDYLFEAEMNREAGVEYERLVKAYPDDSNSVRASIQGGEAAFLAQDMDRAYRLFLMAESMNPPASIAGKIQLGKERCEKILSLRPKWAKKQASAQALKKELGEQKVRL
jgi:membrane associated rhomboid family serine protease